MPWKWLSFAKYLRRRQPAPHVTQSVDEQKKEAVTRPRKETNKPVAQSKLEKFIFQSISVHGVRGKGEKVDYLAHLNDRQIKTGKRKYIVRAVVSVFAGMSLVAQFFFAFVFSTAAGFLFTCSQSQWSLGCQTQINHEYRIPFIRADNGEMRLSPEKTGTRIETEPQQGELFNFVVFEALLVAFAFGLGFVRWQIGNQQAALNSVFERKKELNLLFLDKEKRELLEPLILGATDPEEMMKARGEQVACKEQAIAILDKCQSLSELGSDAFIPTGKKVYVFMELDNLEFAYEKYMSGYLDAEQMHRSCEILESRCLSKEFRYLAVAQGLVYYNKSFHCVVAACIVRGYLLSGGEIPT